MVTQSGVRNPIPVREPDLSGKLYYALVIATFGLLFIGMVMILSASTTVSYKQFNNQYIIFLRQLMFAAIGVVLMMAISRLPKVFFLKWSVVALVISIVLLILVLIPSIGISVAGQRNWISLWGPFRLQPSEVAKLTLIVWGSAVLSKQIRSKTTTWQNLLIPVFPVGLIITVLVIFEGDLGTTLIIGPILLSLFYAVGAPMKLFTWSAMAGLLAILYLSIQETYRIQRFLSWISPTVENQDAGWQVTHGKYALASGGWTGIGLGASREKWGWLPAAHTDFIFAVVGEEIGLVGTIIVLIFIGTIAYVALTLARETNDRFTKLIATSVMAWIVVQSIINIGAVLGLLPVTGVPLPLVSYGGSSLIFTLAAIGVLMAVLRAEPTVKADLKKKKSSRVNK
ncbi:MAG: putative lipid II flippase FtsW [Candidatus Nanopelagicales bacterium]|jgi:cell division protein FtsW|nr:putative lipid II flippase FtsW [Candidatus Nanopelagicales bacterium]